MLPGSAVRWKSPCAAWAFDFASCMFMGMCVLYAHVPHCWRIWDRCNQRKLISFPRCPVGQTLSPKAPDKGLVSAPGDLYIVIFCSPFWTSMVLRTQRGLVVCEQC